MVNIDTLLGGVRVWHVVAKLDGVTLWSDSFAARGRERAILTDAKARVVEEKWLTDEQADKAEWQIN